MRFFALIFILSGCSMPYTKSDHFDGSRFHNLNRVEGDKGLWQILKWRFTSNNVEWPKENHNQSKPQISENVEYDQCAITFINHASALIQFSGLNILTDPIFSERASPFSWLGPKRVRKPGLLLNELPKIHVVLISHNHYDHLDVPSIKQIWQTFRPLFIVPLGNADLIKSLGVENVLELDWWQSFAMNENQSIILTPAQHWSARGLFDKRKTLWGSFVVTSKNLQVFFAGDTGYSPHFKLIRERLGAMDVSLLPIGAYKPRWFMQENHMDPKEAVKAHVDLSSKMSLGIHFNTFQLSDEAIDEPQKDLSKNLLEHAIDEKAFIAPNNGQTIIYKKS